MRNTRTIGRIGILAAGLGIGAAMAAIPGIASANTSTDWWSSIDSLLGGAVPAATSTTDFQISFNGTDLFPTTDNLATADTVAGQYGLAIAYGDNSFAYAAGGTGDFALADGNNASAEAGATTVGTTGNNDDSAVDIGNNADSTTNLGAFAGNGSLQGGADVGTDSNDSAYDIGNNIGNNGAATESSGAFAGDFAGAGGQGDTAVDFGNNSSSADGAIAAGGNNDTAIADTNYSLVDQNVTAESGNDNYASVYGPDNSIADAGIGGNGDIAYVDDPFATVTGTPDTAFAGIGGSNDLAEVLFTHGIADASVGNSLYDIITLFGNFATP